MRKNLNSFRVEGYVYDSSKLAIRETGPTSKNPGTTYISGELEVAVDEVGLNVIPVHFTYVTETYTRSGEPNNTYSVLNQIIARSEDTWIKEGKEKALKVRIDGYLGLNDFISKNGQRVSEQRCEGSFINIVNVLNKEANRNTFIADMVISRVNHVDADPEKNINADYTVLHGAVFKYNNDLLPIELVVKSKEGMKYFESLDTDEEPYYTKVWGNINSFTTQIRREEESAFGEAAVTVFERKNREWAVTGAAKFPYEFGEEDVLTEEELTTAIQNREIYLADVKRRHDEYLASKNNPINVTNIGKMEIKKNSFDF